VYTASQLNEIVGLFGLAMTSHEELQGGSKWTGRRYAVATDAGKFFLKVRSEWWSLAQTQYVCGLLDYLASQQFPVPRIRRTPSGAPYVVCQGHICECHEFVEGQLHAFGQLNQIKAAGRALSRLHSLTATYPLPGGLLPDSYAHRSEQSIRSFSSHVREMFAQDAGALARLDHVLNVLLDMDGDGAPHSPANFALVHGDYQPTNLLFRGDDVVAVCDFDCVQGAPQAFDAAYFLYRAAGRPSRRGGGVASLDPEIVEAFLDGYLRDRPTPPSPLASDSVAHELLRFAWFNALLVAYNTRDPRKLDEWSADTLALARELEQWKASRRASPASFPEPQPGY